MAVLKLCSAAILVLLNMFISGACADRLLDAWLLNQGMRLQDLTEPCDGCFIEGGHPPEYLTGTVSFEIWLLASYGIYSVFTSFPQYTAKRQPSTIYFWNFREALEFMETPRTDPLGSGVKNLDDGRNLEIRDGNASDAKETMVLNGKNVMGYTFAERIIDVRTADS